MPTEHNKTGLLRFAIQTLAAVALCAVTVTTPLIVKAVGDQIRTVQEISERVTAINAANFDDADALQMWRVIDSKSSRKQCAAASEKINDTLTQILSAVSRLEALQNQPTP